MVMPEKAAPVTGTTLRTTSPVPADSRQLLLLLFPIFSELVANPIKLVYTVANPARGLQSREKRARRESLAAHPPLTLLVQRKKVNNIDYMATKGIT